MLLCYYYKLQIVSCWCCTLHKHSFFRCCIPHIFRKQASLTKNRKCIICNSLFEGRIFDFKGDILQWKRATQFFKLTFLSFLQETPHNCKVVRDWREDVCCLLFVINLSVQWAVVGQQPWEKCCRQDGRLSCQISSFYWGETRPDPGQDLQQKPSPDRGALWRL